MSARIILDTGQELKSEHDADAIVRLLHEARDNKGYVQVPLQGRDKAWMNPDRVAYVVDKATVSRGGE